MKNLLRYLGLVLVSVFFFVGCNSNTAEEEDSFSQYDDTYIGDASAVGDIIRNLPMHENFDEMELETKEEPYGMTIKYGDIVKDTKESVLYNATFLLTLISNANWITFEFPNQSYTVSKAKLQDWYGEVLGDYTDEEDLRNRIEENLEHKELPLS